MSIATLFPWPPISQLSRSQQVAMAKHGEVPMAALNSPPDEEIGKAAIVFHAQPRRKATGPKAWLIVSDSGESHVQEVGRHFIMRRTGLPARDLRVLDPVLSYPSSILGRERAIVVNLEHIKAIITAKEVLMLNSNSPLVLQFVQDLQNRISSSTLPPQQVICRLLPFCASPIGLVSTIWQ